MKIKKILGMLISTFCFVNVLLSFNYNCIAEETDKRFIQVSAGREHGIALREDGTVWAWGRGTEGQLGNGKFENSAVPVQVEGLKNISKVEAGGYHNLAMDESGNVWSWGSSDNGQLGIGTHVSRATPQKVEYNKLTEQSPYDIAAGDKHSIILTSEEVIGFGRNAENQLGTPSFGNEKQRPGIIAGYSWEDEKHVYNIAAGGDTTCLTEPNSDKYTSASIEIAAWGKNIGETARVISRNYDRYIDMSIYDSNIAFLTYNGEIIIYGPLNNADIQGATSISVGNDYILANKNDGSVYIWGNNIYSESYLSGGDSVSKNPVKMPIDNIKGISAGYDFALFLDKSGSIWGIGKNTYGQLGNGTTKNTSTATKILSFDFVYEETSGDISAGYTHTLAVKKDGTVCNVIKLSSEKL